MKKNTKIILGSVIGIAVLGAATLALVLTQPKSDNADSGTSSSKTVSVTDYTACKQQCIFNRNEQCRRHRCKANR